MISSQKLYDLAKCRFDEAKILLENHKYEGAVYLGGYAVELVLKRRIVQVLDWDSYPENKDDFSGYRTFKVHTLQELLHLSGLEKKIKANSERWADWNIVQQWKSEIRYREVGSLSETEARDTIRAMRETILFILRHQ